MQQTNIYTYSEQKSIFNALGKNILILNQNKEIEMVSTSFLNIIRKPEQDIIGKNCCDLFRNLNYKCVFCGDQIDNKRVKNYPVIINEIKYYIKYEQINDTNRKYIIIFDEASENKKNYSNRLPNQKKRKKENYKVFINEYGVFLKVFKEIPMSTTILKKTDDENFIITTYNDRFENEFNVKETNLFFELFLGFPRSWMKKNMSKNTYNQLLIYNEFFHKQNNKYYNLYFKYLTSGLFLFTIIDITDKVELQRTMINSIYDSIDEERRRIARDLHDGLGAILSSVAMRLNVIKSGKLKADKVENILKSTSDLIEMAINNAREIAHNIKPYELKDSDFNIAVHSFIEKVRQSGTVEIVLNNSYEGKILNEEKETHVFRILCELINNTLKHSGADLIQVNINDQNQRLYFEYKDNGNGFRVDNITQNNFKNMGIKNIMNRTREMNGACKFISNSGNGMRFKLLI